MYFSLQICLILNLLITIGNKLFGKFFNLLSFFLQLLDSLTLDLNHFFEVIALNNQFRDSLLVLSFVYSTNFNQNIQPLVLKQWICILILYFFYFLFYLGYFLFLFFNLLFIFKLTLIIVLDDFQLFQPLCQYLIFIKVRI